MSKSIKLKNNVYLDNRAIYGSLQPIGTRLLFFGHHQFTRTWSDLTKLYQLITADNLRTGYHRWYRFVVWKNDNATNTDYGLQIGIFDQNGNYRLGYNFTKSWGSGQDEWGSFFKSQFIGYDTLNIGWVYLKTIIPSSSNGTQGYLFSLALEEYDFPTGVDPNNM